jgi:excisionase family DNA binding protein
MTTINEENNIDDWISQAEAARMRGVSKQAIAKLIARKRLSAREIGGRMLVRHSEVADFIPMPIGRPSKKSTPKKAAQTKAIAKNPTTTKKKTDEV